MQPISPYQLSPQDAQRIQYIPQTVQQGQPVKVLTSSVIPQQQIYDPQVLNQTQIQPYDNSFSYNAPRSQNLISANGQQIAPQVLQYSTQPIVNAPQKKVKHVSINGQQAVPLKVQYTDRLGDPTEQDKFKFSNISSISHNNSMFSHSRKASDRQIPYPSTLVSQIVQPNLSQVINPLATYNQQLQIHQQQKDKLNELQNKSMNVTYVSNIYTPQDDNEKRLQALIQENENLIKENEYLKRCLQGQPIAVQNTIVLQQQMQQQAQQNESLQVQLQIQRDEATMWSNREKEMNDRCKSLYEQLQLVKNQDQVSLASQNQQLQFRISQLEQNGQVQQKKIDELNACLQVYKDSMKSQGIVDLTNPNQANNVSQVLSNYQSNQYPAAPNSSNGFSDTNRYQFSQISPISAPVSSNLPQVSPLTNLGNYANNDTNNQYAYSTPKEREDLVQNIIQQYKLGGAGSSSVYPNQPTQNAKADEYTYNIKPAYSSAKGNPQLQDQQDFDDWKSKYNTLTQKLNSLNTGGAGTEVAPSNSVY